ncbi:MAG TPA: trigger factor [Planctomycetaceae bacterium]|nr:trigger factor [Planctomycetaceae bacterium]
MADTETQEEPTIEAPKLECDAQIEEKGACERHVVITIAGSEVNRYRKQAIDEVMPKAELPGFRAGKAPRRLVESKFKEQVTDQVKSNLVMDSLQQVTDGDHFSAISEPSFDYEAIEIPDDGDFKYEFTIEVRPDFDTPNWEGLSLDRPVCEISDKIVDEHLARTLVRFMPGEPVDGEIQLGDTIKLTGAFSHDGKEIAEFDEESVAVREKLAFGDAIVEDFGALVAGKKEGDTVTTKVTIGESAAAEELRGQEVEATFTIVEAQRIAVEEIDASTLDSLGFDDKGDLREFVREELSRQFEYHQQKALREQIVAELTKGADWELPESLVRRQTNRELQRMTLELQRSGFNQEQIKSYLNASRMNAQETTVAALREHFVLEKIAEDLEVEPTAEDYDREVELIAEQNDSSPRRIRARLEKSGQMDAIRNQIIERVVIEKITEAGKLTDKEDDSFLPNDSDTANIDFAIAGDFVDIPEAQHDNDPAAVPGAPKLPEAEKKED